MITYTDLGKNGRLGNQLWEIAATLGIAHSREEAACLPTSWPYRGSFSLPPELYGDDEAVEAFELLEASHIDSRSRIYLQDYNLFHSIAEQVRAYFRPSKAAAGYLLENHGEFYGPEKRVALHFRRGDYVNLPRHFPIPSMSYYKAALREYSGHQPVVFSDDIKWCMEHLPSSLDRDDLTFFEGMVTPVEVKDRQNDPMDWVDLQLMSLCDGHIISNSTFSWWGAFLSSNNAPIYPDKWFGSELSYIDSSLMFPSRWEKRHAS